MRISYWYQCSNPLNRLDKGSYWLQVHTTPRTKLPNPSRKEPQATDPEGLRQSVAEGRDIDCRFPELGLNNHSPRERLTTSLLPYSSGSEFRLIRPGRFPGSCRNIASSSTLVTTPVIVCPSRYGNSVSPVLLTIVISDLAQSATCHTAHSPRS